MKPKPHKHKLIYLLWEDSVADSGWEATKNLEDVHLCETVGYLIGETKQGYVVASTVSGAESNARITVPKSGVLRKRYLKA